MIARKLRARSDFKTLPKSVQLKHKKKKKRSLHHHQPPGSDSEYESASDSEGLSSEDESHTDYRKGGYHPVKIGEIYNGRYIIEKKLGFGYFSTVWLASDNTKTAGEPHKLVAIKFQKSASHYTEAAEDEIKILSQIHSKSSPLKEFIVQLLDKFAIHGPHGKHVCMVFEVMWKDLLFLVKKFKHRGLPVSLLKIISYQVLCGLELLHDKCQIIHTDLKPENFLITLPKPIDVSLIQKDRSQQVKVQDLATMQSDIEKMKASKLNKNQKRRLKSKIKRLQQISDLTVKNKVQGVLPPSVNPTLPPPTAPDPNHKFIVKIADLGNGCWVDRHFTDDVATRQYRPPEVIVGYPYGTSLDIFSAGTMLYELATGDFLFNPERESADLRNEKHLSLMTQVMGPLPRKLIRMGKYAKIYLDREGQFKHIHTPKTTTLESLLQKNHFPEKEVKGFATFLKTLLHMNPDHRATAAKAKLDPWLEEVHKGYTTQGATFFQFPDMDQEVSSVTQDQELMSESETDRDPESEPEDEKDEKDEKSLPHASTSHEMQTKNGTSHIEEIHIKIES